MASLTGEVTNPLEEFKLNLEDARYSVGSKSVGFEEMHAIPNYGLIVRHQALSAITTPECSSLKLQTVTVKSDMQIKDWNQYSGGWRAVT